MEKRKLVVISIVMIIFFGVAILAFSNLRSTKENYITVEMIQSIVEVGYIDNMSEESRVVILSNYDEFREYFIKYSRNELNTFRESANERIINEYYSIFSRNNSLAVIYVESETRRHQVEHVGVVINENTALIYYSIGYGNAHTWYAGGEFILVEIPNEVDTILWARSISDNWIREERRGVHSGMPVGTEEYYDGEWHYTIAMGTRATGGFRLELDRIYIDKDRNMEVVVREITPRRGAITTQAQTYPTISLTLSERPNSIVVKNTQGEIFEKRDVRMRIFNTHSEIVSDSENINRIISTYDEFTSFFNTYTSHMYIEGRRTEWHSNERILETYSAGFFDRQSLAVVHISMPWASGIVNENAIINDDLVTIYYDIINNDPLELDIMVGFFIVVEIPKNVNQMVVERNI